MIAVWVVVGVVTILALFGYVMFAVLVGLALGDD